MPVEKKKKNLIEKGVKSTKSEFTKEETKWQVNVYFEKSSISLSLGDKGNDSKRYDFTSSRLATARSQPAARGSRLWDTGSLPLCPWHVRAGELAGR